MKKEKQSKADFLRSWRMPYPHFPYSSLRYKNPPEKGVYWFYFSRFVRGRDVTEYGTCISCGRPITVETSQAGHFAPASSCGRDLIFDPINVNAECERCNAWDEGHLFGYERNLRLRYGDVAVDDLKRRYHEYRESKTPLKDHKADFYVARLGDLGVRRLSTGGGL